MAGGGRRVQAGVDLVQVPAQPVDDPGAFGHQVIAMVDEQADLPGGGLPTSPPKRAQVSRLPDRSPETGSTRQRRMVPTVESATYRVVPSTLKAGPLAVVRPSRMRTTVPSWSVG
jgi:hypothetical protein